MKDVAISQMDVWRQFILQLNECRYVGAQFIIYGFGTLKVEVVDFKIYGSDCDQVEFQLGWHDWFSLSATGEWREHLARAVYLIVHKDDLEGFDQDGAVRMACRGLTAMHDMRLVPKR